MNDSSTGKEPKNGNENKPKTGAGKQSAQIVECHMNLGNAFHLSLGFGMLGNTITLLSLQRFRRVWRGLMVSELLP